ncbi:hypothetical protein GCM10007049_04130 [Echinicola pacifica]|uniref:DUF4136 domain-containing protein n=1 Tax=Echinicola pacifica TaxID=346377 RepID=A0A918PMH2_9BACT|nr:DUF4136 domain-containing protein [Echinicola pacifica]GGZ15237.1 hypothetical protein GCM10007049_04130 [Echinicola pacifica]
MKRILGLVILTGTLLMVSCSPVRVYLEKNKVKPNQNFSSFTIINEYMGKDAWNSPSLDENLRQALISGMEDQGYHYNEDAPDLILRYNTLLSDGEKEVRESSPYGMSPYGMYNPYMYRYPYRNSYWPSQTEIEKYKLGEVVIDFIDPRVDELVMRISAVGEVNNMKQKYKNIEESAGKILYEFSRNMKHRGAISSR